MTLPRAGKAGEAAFYTRLPFGKPAL